MRLVVLLDAWDWYKLKDGGEENRGVFYPVNNATYSETDWPFHRSEGGDEFVFRFLHLANRDNPRKLEAVQAESGPGVCILHGHMTP